jgi:hypothetical protein
MGSIMKTTISLWVLAVALEIKYAIGYAIIKQITVAKNAKQSDLKKISR